MSAALLSALLALLPRVGLALVFAVIALRYGIATRRRMQRKKLLLAQREGERLQSDERTRIVGFFHPYCNAGGGGERVLWTALACMQREEQSDVGRTFFVVYTGDVGIGAGKASKEEVLAKAQARFGIEIDPSSVAFIPLRHRWLVEDSTWPRLTLLGQSLGSVLLAVEGLFRSDGLIPDYWIDTMGYAFTYPLVKYLCRIPVASYTHYPTISTDMLDRVRSRLAGHTNSSLVARSRFLSTLKLAYYRVFAAAYTASLSCADVIWVNSSWTRAHVESLLDTGVARASEQPAAARRRTIRLLYPPCDTAHLARFPLESKHRLPPAQEYVTILSLAQFRPEKEHATQLHAFAELLGSLIPSLRESDISLRENLRLVLAGSVRNSADAARVESLRTLAKVLQIAEQVDFRVNEPYEVICDLMKKATIGLHTMIDEHFGITVVEFQAAGLIPLAHASAGPLNDIIVPSGDIPDSTGFLAPLPSTSNSSSDSPTSPFRLASAFAQQLRHILTLPLEKQDRIRRNARENAVKKFSSEVFERGWLDGWRVLSEGSGSRASGGGKKED
ncbi:hypothetical protein JCM10908_005038 [Rhodotorula pacifica]|uniref:alpha-1,2-mannosyltransferase ALG11 n=1 Tax=Rhodotorula pacifica TaxID=1495444 RepID=UPI00317301B0